MLTIRWSIFNKIFSSNDDLIVEVPRWDIDTDFSTAIYILFKHQFDLLVVYKKKRKCPIVNTSKFIFRLILVCDSVCYRRIRLSIIAIYRNTCVHLFAIFFQ